MQIFINQFIESMKLIDYGMSSKKSNSNTGETNL